MQFFTNVITAINELLASRRMRGRSFLGRICSAHGQSAQTRISSWSHHINFTYNFNIILSSLDAIIFKSANRKGKVAVPINKTWVRCTVVNFGLLLFLEEIKILLDILCTIRLVPAVTLVISAASDSYLKYTS